MSVGHVLAHFARILLAAGLLAGVLAGNGPARAQDDPDGDSPDATAPQDPTRQKIAGDLKAAQGLIHDGKLAEARAALLAALALDPRNGDTHALLAAVAAKSERWSEALASYQKALEIGPARSAHHYGMGVCKRALNDFPGARDALAKASELGEKELTDARTTLAELRAAAARSPSPAPNAAPAKAGKLALAVRVEAVAVATLTEVNYQLAVVARELGDEDGEGAVLERGADSRPRAREAAHGEGSLAPAQGATSRLPWCLSRRRKRPPGVELTALYDLGRALLRVPGREAEGRAKLDEYVQRDAARRAKVSDERRRSQAASLVARAEVELREGSQGSPRATSPHARSSSTRRASRRRRWSPPPRSDGSRRFFWRTSGPGHRRPKWLVSHPLRIQTSPLSRAAAMHICKSCRTHRLKDPSVVASSLDATSELTGID